MLAGLEIDLARELARRWLGDADAVQFRQVRTDTAMEHLQAGTVDIVLAGSAHAASRDRRRLQPRLLHERTGPAYLP